MKSDKEFYALFKSQPELLKLLTPIRARASYRFRSETVKALERRLDGCFESTDLKDPIVVLEVQARKKENIYPRTIIEMAMLGLEYPDREVKGVLLFLTASHDPKTKPWVSFARTCRNCFRVVYLDQVLIRLAEQEPDHPFVAVFQPLLLSNSKRLRQQATKYFRIIQNANLPEKVKTTYEQVFFSWMSQRFTKKHFEEITKMITDLTPFEETRVFKQFLAIADEKNGFTLREKERELESERQAKERERQAKERERQAKERERQAKEWERQAKERERQAKERECLEKERLLAILRKAGIDPSS